MRASRKYAPFSAKQKVVLTWWCEGSEYKDKDGIICDGSIRSGKTKSMGLSYCIWAMETFQEETFALCGKTIQSLRRNVIKGLKSDLIYRGYTVEDKRADNLLIISTKDTTNEFYLFGGKDEGSQDLIQGITLAGVFFDEAALMPESFINQATGRCSVTGSKIWFNCNPEGPQHYFKTEWIDRLREKNLIRIHFTMEDNLSLAPEILERYKRMYKGVFYDRFILGLWVLASGIIFKFFAENPEPYTFEDQDLLDEDGNQAVRFSKLVIGLDFGGNGSKTTMVLNGYIGGFKEFRILEEDSLPITEEIDSKAICDKYVEFYKRCAKKYGRIDWTFPDSASTTMINSLRSAAREAGIDYRHIAGCRKNEIKDRPKTMDMLLNTGRLKINKRCQEVITAISSLRWDEKNPEIPEDKNIGNVNDWWDALMYTMLDFIEAIDLNK